MIIVILFVFGVVVFFNWTSYEFLTVIPLIFFDNLANFIWGFLGLLTLLFIAWCFDD